MMTEETKNIKKEDKKQAAKPVRKKRIVKRKIKKTRAEKKPEFEQKILEIRRVTRVVAGGRRFSFSVLMVIGNRNGKVGVGLGKSNDTSFAIQKAFANAKRNLIEVKRTESGSIAHDVSSKFGASEVVIRPAKGRGLVAGSAARTVLELAGVTDVTSKIMTRSKNKINIARATVNALKSLKA